MNRIYSLQDAKKDFSNLYEIAVTKNKPVYISTDDSKVVVMISKQKYLKMKEKYEAIKEVINKDILL